MRHRLEKMRRYIVGAPRMVAVALATLALSCGLFSICFMTRTVTVIDDANKNAPQVVLTNAEHPTEILKLVGMRTEGADQVIYTASSSNNAQIMVRRAYPVVLVADGTAQTTEILEGTVNDVLNALGVSLGQDDYTEPGLTTKVTENMQIEVHRVTYSVKTSREEISTEGVEAYTLALASGEVSPVMVKDAGGEQVAIDFKQSMNGMYDVTYRSTLVNGDETLCELLALVPVLQPRDEGSTEFIDGVPCSTIAEFEGITLGADGLPTEYTRKISGAVTTAYSSSGGRGSSGLGLYCGTVAVNPNVIPYGTRMFITSPDNGFVYGFAIATDTGTALMDGRVDIDIYFATNAECRRFGKRALDVYVLD